MDETELTACPASRENVDHLLHQRRNWCHEFQNNARAKLLPETLALQDPKDRTDHREMPDHLAPMANPEIWDHEDHPVILDLLVNLVKKAHLVIPEKLLAHDQVHQVHLDPQANPAVPVKVADQASPAAMEIQAAQDQLETPDKEVLLAELVVQVHPETVVVPAQQAVAIIAHRLVWHRAINERKTRFHYATPKSSRHPPDSYFSTFNWTPTNRNLSAALHLRRRSMWRLHPAFVCLFALFSAGTSNSLIYAIVASFENKS